MREIFVTELVKEVLGPRFGIHETLTESPLNEYITGVLTPVITTAPDEKSKDAVDDEAEIPVEDVKDGTYEGETDDVDVDVPPMFSPALDPKSRSPSMGISFILQSPEIPKLDLCLTWARYFSTGEEKNQVWKRNPRAKTLKIDLDANRIFYFDGTGKQLKGPTNAEIALHILVRKDGKDRYFVTLHLVDAIKLKKDERPAVEHYIFQPQIRILKIEPAEIVPGLRRVPKNEEEEKLEFLYRHRPVLARGHLCSAMWKDIDPELQVPQGTKIDFSQCSDEPPFKWLDGDLVSPQDRVRFYAPDVRTEFVPAHSVTMPDLAWRTEYGSQPETKAANLAELWDPVSLRSALMPLADGYRRWIDQMDHQSRSLSTRQAQIAAGIIQECRIVLDRIIAGVERLCNDNDARLAFCFANKAMDLQSGWPPRRQPIVWYPFQLAFLLMTIESIINAKSQFRNVCDLLWVPTGAGKTEAYFAVVAFTFAYRRLKSLKNVMTDKTGAGVSVITRYTLRLLTIQQFRRAVSLITACESLRVHNLPGLTNVGWRPAAYGGKENFIWGSTPFSIGLWVGGNVTPNRMKTIWPKDSSGTPHPVWGAIDILRGTSNINTESGEPAQILNCPACESILAIPDMGLRSGLHVFHFVVSTQNNQLPNIVPQLTGQTLNNVNITNATSIPNSAGFHTLRLEVQTGDLLTSEALETFWEGIVNLLRNRGCDVRLSAARASRPGYFLRYYVKETRNNEDYDFDIFCPNNECSLRQQWCASAPMGCVHATVADPNAWVLGVGSMNVLPDGNAFTHVQEPFRVGGPFIADRIPIPAMTVDDQIYRRLPTMIVATVDKFARPPFEPKAGALFGNIDYHHCINGYYRLDSYGHPSPSGRSQRNFRQVPSLTPPDLILQDELHLIEGPLGSLVGIYETAVDLLSAHKKPAKYIASTATIRRAEEQVQAVFVRKTQLFPPYGITSDDRFLVKERDSHPLDDSQPGRLYIGISALGRGPLTPLVRIWSRLMQTAYNHRGNVMDPFWTLTGYFNAVRELAGAKALYRQDIPQRIDQISSGNSRPMPDERAMELSGRTKSTDLPSILDILSRPYPFPDAADALFTTSMFGTGVDISRIGLMVVNGQPKTTSAYIQSTGRVGRRKGAVVVTFFRASRPRDLSHYEFFCGYHYQLHRFVEPITVYPFAPGVLERAAGPVGVFILRNMRGSTTQWHRDDTAIQMAAQRNTAREVLGLPTIMENRATVQPQFRRPQSAEVDGFMRRRLDLWHAIASNRNNADLAYVEYAISTLPTKPVVLGDSQHAHSNHDVVYENVPQSLRDIEDTAGFQT